MPRQSRVHETDLIIDAICRLDFVSFVRIQIASACGHGKDLACAIRAHGLDSDVVNDRQDPNDGGGRCRNSSHNRACG